MRVARVTSGIGSRLFSDVGALVAWLLVACVATTTWLTLIRSQNESTKGVLFALGCWWIAGLIAIHWRIPEGGDIAQPLQGIAAGGWHALIAMSITAVWVWNAFFDGTVYRNPGLGGATSALFVWFGSSVFAGTLVIWMRGHTSRDVIRYSLIGTLAGSIWMGLGLTFSLSAA